MKHHKERPLWRLEQAVTLVRIMSEWLNPKGWGVGLTGGVLIKGKSNNDMDIIVFPHNATTDSKADKFVVHDTLKFLGFQFVASTERVHQVWRSMGSTDVKQVEVWKYLGKKVDIFYLE